MTAAPDTASARRWRRARIGACILLGIVLAPIAIVVLLAGCKAEARR